MMLFPAVLINFPNSEVCLIGEWSINLYFDAKSRGVTGVRKATTSLKTTLVKQQMKEIVDFLKISDSIK